MLMEGYLEATICAMIGIQNLNWELSGPAWSSATALVLFPILNILPIAVMVFLLVAKRKNLFEQKVFNEKYGSLYEGIDLTEQHNLYYNSIFMAHRYIFASIGLFLNHFSVA